MTTEVAGENSLDAAFALANLASFYFDRDRFAEAEPFQRLAVEKFTLTLGREHPHTCQTLRNFAMVQYRAGRLEESIQTFEETIRIFRQLHPSNPVDLPVALLNYTHPLMKLNRLDESESALLEAFDLLSQLPDVDPTFLRLVTERLAMLYERQQKTEEAATWRARLGELDSAVDQ
jgi:tetratricopeptide (TPR) repeat protein